MCVRRQPALRHARHSLPQALALAEPFAYVFADKEEHVLKTFIRYQFEQGLLPEQFGVDSLFSAGARSI